MTAKPLGVIGGTLFQQLPELKNRNEQAIHTPFGDCSSALISGELDGRELVFIVRHGMTHSIAPHLINYRANIWALQHYGVQHVLALASVGGIAATMQPGNIVIPDQIIDYTYDRQHTFYDNDFSLDRHTDFTYPYSMRLRQSVVDAAVDAGVPLVNGGTYAATQGPRLETAAEIRRLQNDGCDIVGMTGMPEAVLARELGIEYTCCAVVVNWAAGISDELISIAQIKAIVAKSDQSVLSVLKSFANVI